MPNLAKVAKVSDLEPGGCMIVQAGAQDIALYNVDGRFYATTNTCPHRGGPLGEGILEGSVVTCPWHGWEFDVAKGSHTTNPAAQIQTYNVKIQDEEVFVEL